jgi:sulfatase modifying factor 1
MNKAFVVAAALTLLCLGTAGQADVFHMGPGLTSLDMVTVGDPGNAAELRHPYYTPSSFGGVDHTYNIGKYEVTTAQYCEFLNNKAKSDPFRLYNERMADLTDDRYTGWGCNIRRTGTDGSYVYRVGSGSVQDVANWGNRPVNYISYWDMLRFSNWLNNAQGDGDTETGAYTLGGYTGINGGSILRNPGATWFLPSEDEWYKAAYYKGGGIDAGYWIYATQSDDIPSNFGYDGYDDPGNHVNYPTNNYTVYTMGSPYLRTNVGEFENSASAYGTFDQNGNVWELNDTISIQGDWYCQRVRRGGSFDNGLYALDSYMRDYWYPDGESNYVGFRVASAVPEPSSVAALAGSLAALFVLRRRRHSEEQ